MKKIIYLSISLLIVSVLLLSVSMAQEGAGQRKSWDRENKQSTERNLIQSPVGLLETVKHNANKYKSEEVQNTPLDNTNSLVCNESLWWAKRSFTITRTLCNIKLNMKPYLQYIIYIWLTAATILIIRNWFLLVVSPDRSKQIKTFQKNILYIIIGVALILSFYRILDIFVSFINFVVE